MRKFSYFLLAALSYLLSLSAAANEIALFTVDVKLSGTGVEQLDILLECDRVPPLTLRFSIPVDSSGTYTVPVPGDRNLRCSITAAELPGHQLGFLGDGGSPYDAEGPGCTFTGVERGHSNFCQIQVENEDTSLTVFKRWIGTSDRESDVRIQLDCGAGRNYEPLEINRNRPAVWQLNVDDADGFLCRVNEPGGDSYIADSSDCEDLLILPGAQEECTLVNTKVVKMIEMLNRYGLFVMIAVFMVVGGLAARRVIG